MFKKLLAFVGAMLVAGVASATTTKTVCNSGCDYNNTQLQAAITAAAADTLILLQEGFTYVGDFTLPVKSGVGASAWIEIRTGVSSTGVVQLTSRYPAANTRVCPVGFVQDWYDCATRSPQDMTRFAKLQVSTNNAYGMRTAATGSGTPVSYYRFKYLEFIANTYGGNSIIGLLNDTNPATSGTSAMIPHHFEFDRVVVRGLPASGQFRGMQLDANDVTIANSMFYDIKSVGEGQVIWANSSIGPITVTNNYVSGGTEVWLTGGGSTTPRPNYTVQASPAPTTTTFTLDNVTDLYVGKNIVLRQNPIAVTSATVATSTTITTSTPHGLTSGWQVIGSGITGCAVASGTYDINTVPRRVSVISTTTFSIPVACTTAGSGGTIAVRAQAEITAIAGNQVTVTPALPFAPTAGDIAKSSMVIRNLTVRYNVFTRPASWLTDYVIEKPLNTAVVTATTGGTIAPGTYAYRVVAYVNTAQGQSSNGGAAVEASVVVPAGTSTNKNTITWDAVTNANSYRVYGRTPAGQTTYWTVTAPTTTYVDTGATGSGGSPSGTGSHWQVKNVFELKQARDVILEYNIIENAWQDGQTGPCFLMTGTQQVIAAESAVIRDVLARYNVIRNCMQSIQITGTDALGHESARSGSININNNLIYNVGGVNGKGLKTHSIYVGGTGGGPRQTPDRAPFSVTLNHNTIHFYPTTVPNTAIMFDNCLAWPVATPSQESLDTAMIVTNNIFYAGSYGLSSIGVSSPSCGVGTSQGRVGLPPLGAGSLISTNVLAGASSCTLYNTTTTATVCPSIATLESGTFSNTTSITGFTVKSTSPYYHNALDGASYGADIATINTGLVITQSGDNTGSPVVLPPTVSTPTLPDGQVATAYSQTIAGECRTVTCTWSVTGTLPSGLTFTQVSSVSATLIGTPTVGQTAAFGLVLTDTGAQTGSQQYSVTILDVPPAPVRKRPTANNYSEFGHFLRDVCPTVATDPTLELHVGDQCFNLTNFKLYQLNAVTPTEVWVLVDTAITLPAPTYGSVGGLFYAFGGTSTWSLVASPGTELFATTSARFYTDLTYMTECRLWSRVATTLTGTTFAFIEYSSDGGTTFQALGTTADTPKADLTAIVNDYVVSPWTPIVDAAKADVVLRVKGQSSVNQTATLRNTGFTCR